MPGKCPSTAAEYIAGTPIVGSLSFRTLALIIGWICFGITSVLWVALIIPHFRRYNSPHEQRQIFRIVTTPLIYSLFGLVSIYAYHAAPYLEPVPELYEAYALASLFMLYVHYAAPDTSSREEFFRNVKGMSKGREKPEGSLRHFRWSWRIIFLYVLLYTILFLLQEILIGVGHYCSASAEPKHAHIWISVIELVMTVTALIIVIRFQRRLRDYMQDRQALLKLIVFKLFVLITTVQNFVINIVKTQVKPSSSLTLEDIAVGLPTLLLCIEGMLFTAWFHFTFHSTLYKSHMGANRNLSGMLKAFLHALNPEDLIRGVGSTLRSFYTHHIGPSKKARLMASSQDSGVPSDTERHATYHKDLPKSRVTIQPSNC